MRPRVLGQFCPGLPPVHLDGTSGPMIGPLPRSRRGPTLTRDLAQVPPREPLMTPKDRRMVVGTAGVRGMFTWAFALLLRTPPSMKDGEWLLMSGYATAVCACAMCQGCPRANPTSCKVERCTKPHHNTMLHRRNPPRERPPANAGGALGRPPVTAGGALGANASANVTPMLMGVGKSGMGCCGILLPSPSQ